MYNPDWNKVRLHKIKDNVVIHWTKHLSASMQIIRNYFCRQTHQKQLWSPTENNRNAAKCKEMNFVENVWKFSICFAFICCIWDRNKAELPIQTSKDTCNFFLYLSGEKSTFPIFWFTEHLTFIKSKSFLLVLIWTRVVLYSASLRKWITSSETPLSRRNDPYSRTVTILNEYALLAQTSSVSV